MALVSEMLAVQPAFTVGWLALQLLHKQATFILEHKVLYKTLEEVAWLRTVISHLPFGRDNVMKGRVLNCSRLNCTLNKMCGIVQVA